MASAQQALEVRSVAKSEAGQPSPATKPVMPQRYRLGVLFVHGMGEQARGDTLTEMGDALSEWLRRWVRALPGVDVTLREASLRTPDEEPPDVAEARDRPHLPGPGAHVSVTLEDANHASLNQEWVLAESWWASAFRPATFGELAMWLISVGPSVIAFQRVGIVNRVMQAQPTWASGLFGSVALWLMKVVTVPILYVVGIIVAGLITPLALLLFVLGILPIPFLSDIARAGARNLSGSFGDLLVLVRSPVRFAAMAERVRLDIQALGRRCDRVMVVAHSQGCAVAWHAMRRMSTGPAGDRADVRLFVTFGQALRKLKALYRIHRTGGTVQLQTSVLALATTILILVSSWVVFWAMVDLVGAQFNISRAGIDGSTVIWLAVLAVLVFVAQGYLAAIAGDNDDGAGVDLGKEFEDVSDVFTNLRWIDLWASADPAPNGPLFDKMPDRVESFRIRNKASTVFDHAIYWSNVTEFVSAIAMFAGATAGSDPLKISARRPPELRDAALVRDRRVSLLAAGRVFFLVGAAVALYAVRRLLPDWGRDVLHVLDDLPLIGGWFRGWPREVEGWAAGVLLALAALAAWYAIAWAWGLVIRADEEQFFDRQRSRVPTFLAGIWIALAVLVPTAILLALLWNFEEMTAGLFALYVIGSAFAVLIVWSLLQAGGRRLFDP